MVTQDINGEKAKELVLKYLGEDFEIADKQGLRIVECPQLMLDEINHFQNSDEQIVESPELFQLFEKLDLYSDFTKKEISAEVMRFKNQHVIVLTVGDEHKVERSNLDYDELLLDVHTHPGDLTHGALSLNHDGGSDLGFTGDYSVIAQREPKLFGIINAGSVMLLRKSKEKGTLSHIAKYAYLRYFMRNEFSNILDERERRDNTFEMIFNMNIDFFDESLGEDADRRLKLMEIRSIIDNYEDNKLPKDLDIHPDLLISIALGYTVFCGELRLSNQLFKYEIEKRGLKLSLE